MQIDFQIAGRDVQYFRDPMVGTAEIRTPDGSIQIDSPLGLSTHFSLQLKKEKSVMLYGHAITVEKVRPLWFGGLRPARYRVFVDGVLQAEASGY